MKINEKEYKLVLTGAALVSYKQEFHEDILGAITNIDPNDIDIVNLMQIIWGMAKGCKENNTPDYLTFVEELENLGDLLSPDTLAEITKAIRDSSKTTVELKKN